MPVRPRRLRWIPPIFPIVKCHQGVGLENRWGCPPTIPWKLKTRGSLGHSLPAKSTWQAERPLDYRRTDGHGTLSLWTVPRRWLPQHE